MKCFCCCFAEKVPENEKKQKAVPFENTTQYQQKTVLTTKIEEKNYSSKQDETEATNEIQSQKKQAQDKQINQNRVYLKKQRTLSTYRSKSLKCISNQNKLSIICSNSLSDLQTDSQNIKQIMADIYELREKLFQLQNKARKQSTISIKQNIASFRQSQQDEKAKIQTESLKNQIIITEDKKKQIDEFKQWQEQNTAKFQQMSESILLNQHKKVVFKKQRRSAYPSEKKLLEKEYPRFSLFQKKTPFSIAQPSFLKQLPSNSLTLSPHQSPYITDLLHYMLKERYRIENLSQTANKEAFGWKILHKSKILTLAVKNGSEYHQQHPFVYTEYFFSGIEGINADVFQYLLYNVDVRKKWDPNLMDLKLLENKEEDDSEGQVVYYMANKFPAIFSNRDFVERRVHCYCPEINEHAIIFHYVKDDYFPATKKFVRGYTTIGANFFKQISSNSMQFWSMSQSDLKMRIPQWLVNTFLPSACESWFQKISGLLKEKIASSDQPLVFDLVSKQK